MDQGEESKIGDSICGGLRECELKYLAETESLSLTPKHNVELNGLDKCLLDLTEWALDSGSKDNMTCLIIRMKLKSHQNEIKYERVWCPCDFYPHKIKFNEIDNDEVMDKENAALDRFMRLFEADCAATGWNMGDDYQNALLQKILYLNDLITNEVQKRDIQRLIDLQNTKLAKLESKNDDKSKLIGKKRKKMENDADGDDDNDDDDEGDDGGDAPKKKRKLSNLE